MTINGRHAEIAGAGIAGLTTAAALAQKGWSVRVHERGEELREIGAGIFMWENALRVLEAIGAYDEAIDGGERNQYWEIRDERERLLQSGWMMQGTRLYTILRSQLHKALANAATRAGVEIVVNSRVSGATEDGQLLLENGQKLKADLIVGADGVNSAVRNSLGLAKRVVDLQDGCGRYLIPRIPEDAAGRSLEYWNGGRRVGVVPASRDTVYLYVCCPASDHVGRLSPPDRKSWTKSFPALASYIDRLTDNGRWASFSDVTCHSWRKGNVAILGDAAHAMSPNLGQGAGVSMQTGFVLADELSRTPEIRAALASWEARQRPVVDATQKFSRLYGRVGTRWPRPLLDLRSAFVWGVGKSTRIQRRVNVAAHSDVT
ncbi:putative monooxygenase (plasmid) [Sinorhizobium fredii NGR234]|uniref:Monooxygenase n=1 Tax=Sinorhizobium fredii (strain NBRC 101917 / NGR234) TaxID=394 RepID=C3KN23_SINFN|nr:NAD(P)/FAD-dependent oxidoreductase [Sinorhizobium fredii]ACP21596.1 putative monooxygenase [Sinorhizobium fredii NGR234]